MGGLHEVNDQLETIKPVTKFQKDYLDHMKSLQVYQKLSNT